MKLRDKWLDRLAAFRTRAGTAAPDVDCTIVTLSTAQPSNAGRSPSAPSPRMRSTPSVQIVTSYVAMREDTGCGPSVLPDAKRTIYWVCRHLHMPEQTATPTLLAMEERCTLRELETSIAGSSKQTGAEKWQHGSCWSSRGQACASMTEHVCTHGRSSSRTQG